MVHGHLFAQKEPATVSALVPLTSTQLHILILVFLLGICSCLQGSCSTGSGGVCEQGQRVTAVPHFSFLPVPHGRQQTRIISQVRRVSFFLAWRSKRCFSPRVWIRMKAFPAAFSDFLIPELCPKHQRVKRGRKQKADIS